MENEEMFTVKLIFNEEELEISLNSQYEYFINSICNIFQISSKEFDQLSLSYIDNEGDNIILSSEEDYNIFFEQLSQEQVDNIKISIQDNSELDQNICLINLLNYKEKIEVENNNQNLFNNNIDSNININNNIKYEGENKFSESENKNIQESNINENNVNNSYINGYQDFDDFNKIINENNQNQNKNNEDIPIDDLIFDYQCSHCKKSPILCKIFYCAECSYYLYQECERNDVKHEHNLLKIDSREKLRKIKEKENEELEKKIKEMEKSDKKEYQKLYPKYNNFNNYNYQNYPQMNPNSHLMFRNSGNRRTYYINGSNMSNNYNQNQYLPYPYHPNNDLDYYYFRDYYNSYNY